MAQSVRQRNLFAAEDFTVVYDTFKQANFQSYDYDTIRDVMVEYIRTNYPENFNDWIQSSEFVALIEMFAMLSHNLAFRADLAGRENFLSTAERRASILRIADFLGYNPSRSLPARGQLKIQSVRTTQNVFDVTGQTLKSKQITFNDALDPNSYQNFLLVMNEIFTKNSQFGRPSSTTQIGNVETQTYTTNTAPGQDIVKKFTSKVNGNNQPFEIINQSIVDNGLVEPAPNPDNKFNIVYKNDNQGIASANTGFFVGFKQGTLTFSDYNADTAVSNLSVNINTSNINNMDTWVQTVDETGGVINDWTKIDATFGTSAVYNAVSNKNRTLFSIKTRDNDQITVDFGDGVFADVPRGTMRIWYRTGLNETYTLNKDDVGTVSFSFDYIAKDGNRYTASFTASLEESISNASSRESVSSIKTNSGRVFKAQDRMITHEDYNVYPLSVSDNIRKIKSINRTHSGHSRFIDINDPTAQYQNVNIVGDDGYIYGEDVIKREMLALPSNLTDDQIFDKFISNIPSNPETVNFYYQKFNPISVGYTQASTAYTWNQVTSNAGQSTGYLTRSGVIQRVGASVTTQTEYVKIGSIIEFVEDPFTSGSIGEVGDQLQIVSGGFGYTSAPTVTIVGTGTGATAQAIMGSVPDPSNPTQTTTAVVSIIVTNGGQGYTNPVVVSFSGGGGQGASAIAKASSAKTSWARVVKISSDGLGVDDNTGNPTGKSVTGQGAIVLNKTIPNTARIKRIVKAYNTQFTALEKSEIVKQIRLRNNFGVRYDDVNSRWQIINGTDLVSNINSTWSDQYTGNTSGLNLDNSWIIRASYSSDEWTFLTRVHRIIFGSTESVRFYNQNDKVKWNSETNKPERDTITIFKTNPISSTSPFSIGEDLNFFSYKYFAESDGHTDDHKFIATLSDITNGLYPQNPMAFRELINGDYLTLTTIKEDGYEYIVLDPNSDTVQTSDSYPGRFDLTFQWKRIADSDQRIDPSLSNIIDVFCLTQSYDLQYREWLTKDKSIDTIPLPPTSDQLKKQFNSLDTKRSISDSIIYRSAKYKPLFGVSADSLLQASFRVIKVKGTTLSDTEIKNSVLEGIDEFFNIDNWEFGETFYFTELAAYLHNKLLGVISSIVIVPLQEESAFGTLFQVTPSSDELFIPDIDLNSIEIVSNFTGTNLRAKN